MRTSVLTDRLEVIVLQGGKALQGAKVTQGWRLSGDRVNGFQGSALPAGVCATLTTCCVKSSPSSNISCFRTVHTESSSELRAVHFTLVLPARELEARDRACTRAHVHLAAPLCNNEQLWRV